MPLTVLAIYLLATVLFWEGGVDDIVYGAIGCVFFILLFIATF